MLTRCGVEDITNVVRNKALSVNVVQDGDLYTRSFSDGTSPEPLAVVEFIIRDGKAKVQQAFRRA